MSSCCSVVSQQFDADRVADEVARRERDGPGTTATLLVEALVDTGAVDGATLLDVGAGLGDIQQGLFPEGLRAATHVEASQAYSDAARKLVDRAGYADRARHVVGDIVDLSGNVEIADLVTLDRVICCYDDADAMLEATLPNAIRVFGLSAPGNGLLARMAIAGENLVRRLRGNRFRMFVHSWPLMDRRIQSQGFELVREEGTWMWRVAIYRRLTGKRS